MVGGHTENGKFHPHGSSKPGIKSTDVHVGHDHKPGSVKTGKELSNVGYDGVHHNHYMHNKVYPKDLTDEEFDNTFGYDDILMYVDKYDDQMDYEEDEAHKHKVIEHGIKREEFAVDYAKKHDGVIYTQVDREDGEIGYRKGYHMMEAIDGGYYVIVRLVNH